MTTLAQWLQHELDDSGLAQAAARMPLGDEPPLEDDHYLVDEFQGPDEWKEESLRQVQLIRRPSTQPPARFVGEEGT